MERVELPGGAELAVAFKEIPLVQAVAAVAGAGS